MRILLFLGFVSACTYHGNHTHSLSDKEFYQAIPTGRIHRSCLDKFGTKIVNLIDESSKRGMACLQNLKGAGSTKNYLALEKLFQSQALTYHCNETDYGWRGKSAHASLGAHMNKEKFGLVHPFVSINSNYVLRDSVIKGEPLPEKLVSNVMFHEYFHFIGSLHNSTVEYAYTCEECCFDSLGIMENSHKKIACKICKSDYQGVSDPEYLVDLKKWDELSEWKNSVRWDVNVKLALYQSKERQKIWKHAFLDRSTSDLSYKFLADEVMRSGEGKSIPEVVKVGNFKAPPDLEEIIRLAQELGRLEKRLIVDHEVEKVARAFINLDFRPLKYVLRLQAKKTSRDYKIALSLRESALDDMDVLYTVLEGKNLKLALELWEKFQIVKELLPSV